ncbi:MAG: hypothetical protein GXP49_05050 [Deltaproteobacteria bacterium]|nr:hypothetical protein [Deltaproteobacteria bacterium]
MKRWSMAGPTIMFAFLIMQSMQYLGCASLAGKAGTFKFRKGVRATEYYPLEKGWAWSYDVKVFSPDKGEQSVLSTTRVVEASENNRVLKVGRQTYTYILDNKGILKKEAGYHLLREPIVKGASWKIDVNGVKGEVTITDVHAELTTPAGTFTECVVTEEKVPELNSLVRTVFAPGVGIAKVEEFGLVQGKAVVLRTALLRAYTNPQRENI